MFATEFYDQKLKIEDYYKGFKPNGYNYTVACTNRSNVEYPRHTCTAVIYLNNWKIPDDYPW